MIEELIGIKSIRKTTEKYVEEVFELVGNEFEVVGEYIDSRTKIKMIHHKCSSIVEITPSNFLKGRRCVICSGLKKKNTHDFIDEVGKLVGIEYSVLGEYINANTKIKIKHNLCGSEYLVTPSNFLRGKRCAKCRGLIKKTNDIFTSQIESITNEKFELLDDYVNARTRIRIKHLRCGYVCEIIPNSFISGKCKCHKCETNIMNRTTDYFKNEVFDLVGEEYIVFGEYIDSKKHIKLFHAVCENVWNVSPTSFLQGTRCKYCNESRGEKRISKFLNASNISYEPQFKIDDCKNIRKLPFDFAVFNDLNNLIMLIEYDGIQHFQPVRFGGKSMEKATVAHEKIRQNDDIKNSFCLKNNIPLIRIPYWEFNCIEIILKEEMKKYIV